MVWVAGSGIDVAWLLSEDDQPLEARVIRAAEDMLGKASDAIAEITAEPWPARAGTFAGGFPSFQADIADGALVMSYGDPNDPILEFAPIELDNLHDVDA